MKFALSNIVTEFGEKTIGTKVLAKSRSLFYSELQRGIEFEHDMSTDRIRGQMYIPLPYAIGTVSCGVGVKTVNAKDYVLREHRGHVSAYLKRKFACDVDSLAAVVYTKQAYLIDPDVIDDEVEKARINALEQQYTHVIVAVLASAGGPSPLSSHRLVWNLAGGNLEGLVWSGDEIRAKARETVAYWDKYSLVAD